jgi:hypothetical protein
MPSSVGKNSRNPQMFCQVNLLNMLTIFQKQFFCYLSEDMRRFERRLIPEPEPAQASESLDQEEGERS